MEESVGDSLKQTTEERKDKCVYVHKSDGKLFNRVKLTKPVKKLDWEFFDKLL